MKATMIDHTNIDCSLTFVVLTYNHSDFVLEHLESIANLIRMYGEAQRVDLIISDDASRDSTVILVSRWLEKNRHLFRNVITLYGTENVGTCKSLLRATESVNTRYVKVTGGDDLYSNEDIFSVVRSYSDAHVIGSQPLVLIDKSLQKRHRLNAIYAMDNCVYERQSFRRRLIGPGFIYTPGLIYSAEILSNPRVRSFVSRFVLVEDLPIWIAAAECFPFLKYSISESILVYYRRTPGSAYLIAGTRVFADQLACQKHLLATEGSVFNQFIVRNRIWLMNNSSSRVRQVFDLGRVVFFVKLFARLPSAFRYGMRVIDNFEKHQQHHLQNLVRANEVATGDYS